MKSKLWILVLTVCFGLTLSLGTTSQALQVDGDKKIMVFGGRQPAPNIDPSLKTDWSRRMLQQAFYDGLYKYELRLTPQLDRETRELLAAARESAGVAEEAFIVLEPGEGRDIPASGI